jgi:hypothetical protein
MKSYCNQCNRQTNQIVLNQEKLSINDGEGWWEETIYQIIRCSGCDEISFRKLYSDAQIQQYSEYEGEIYVQDLYPKRGPNSIPIKSYNNISSIIKSLYRETIDAFNNEQLILCCGGLRALIEAICLDKAVKGIIIKNKKGVEVLKSNLEAKIEGLAESGYLTKDNAKSLHELRFLGNEALHELEKPSIDELKLAIEIIELTIENIYELQHKAMKLKKRKANRKID